jgi:autotransporter-associated beta strand protein
MPTTTIKPVTLGVNAGNQGTLNLNGGTLSVARVAKGDASASATNNFNGGTLRAVSASFAATFLTGLDRANVRNGGAVLDDGGFAITMDQAFEHSDIAGDHATDGGLTKLGPGVLTLGGTSAYTGPTKVGAGTLHVNGSIAGSSVTVSNGATLGGTGTIAAPVTVAAGGTLAPGASIGTLTFAGNLTVNGNLAIEVDTSVVPAHDVCNVAGTLSAGGGTVTVTNVGPNALNLGDSFPLFNKPVVNGSALTITPAPGVGLAWTNKLAFDGSIAVVAGPTTADAPTNITFSVSGSTLSLTWPSSHLGWFAQSNSVSVAAPALWFDISGSDAVTSLNITIDPALPNVFYRLRHP